MRQLGFLLSVALVAGCGPDEASGGDTDDTESTGSSGTSAETDGGSTPTTMDTSAGSASASGGSSTGTSPGDSSGDGPTATSTGDTGPTDDSGGSDGSTGGNADNPYPPCMFDADPVCPKPLECQSPMQGQVNWCGMECDDVSQCPEPNEGTAVPFCGGPNDVCMLDCSGDATCPTGMDCVGLGMNGQAMRCVWPSGM